MKPAEKVRRKSKSGKSNKKEAWWLMMERKVKSKERKIHLKNGSLQGIWKRSNVTKRRKKNEKR